MGQYNERLQDGDDKVISELYDKYAPALYGVILKIVGSEAVAQDVLQDTFVKIWRNGRAYDPGKGTLFTWMLNIARNTAIDMTRSAAFQRRSTQQSLESGLFNSSQHGTMQHNPDHIGVKRIVGGLEKKYQVIIELIYFKGFTQREVQEYLNLPLGTVKSRARIALRELRRIFEEHHILAIVITLNPWTFL